jgi:hypothetical protein
MAIFLDQPMPLPLPTISVPVPLSAVLLPAKKRTAPSTRSAQMSGMVSPLASGVPKNSRTSLRYQPEAPYSVSTPPEAAAS